jgi:hypothetical protein
LSGWNENRSEGIANRLSNHTADGGEIIGGLGVIENGFHDRKDLTPNACAVYTERERCGNGIAVARL